MYQISIANFYQPQIVKRAWDTTAVIYFIWNIKFTFLQPTTHTDSENQKVLEIINTSQY